MRNVDETDRYSRSTLFEAERQVREEVLRKERVEKVLWQADDFDVPMQQLASEFCGSAVWTRPGLFRKVRNFLNIAMLAALNRSKELETHVRGAIVNGCTTAKIQEALLQSAAYADAPAGVEGFRIAMPIVQEHLSAPLNGGN
jgi:4-carboxymuconolactone decarboxylase